MKKFKIKQLAKETEYAFLWYDLAKKKGFNLDDYEVIYEGEIEEKNNIEATLDLLFYIFNMEMPKDFKGHSLSVSDIVELDSKNYYCDSAGWQEVK